MNEVLIVGWTVGPSTGVDRVQSKWLEEVQLISEAGAQMAMINLGAEWSHDGVVADATVLRPGGDNLIGVPTQDLAIASMRDLTGRLSAGHNVPVLNDQKVIAVAREKSRFYTDFADVTTTTFSFSTQFDAIDAVTALPEGEVVLKPSIGSEASGIFIGTKADAIKFYVDQPLGSLYVAQTRLDTTRLPAGLRGVTEQDNELLTAEGSKEIRLFASNTEFVPVMRVAAGTDHQGQDVYVFVDPESVPEEVYELGTTAMNRLTRITGINEIHGTVDIVFTPDSDIEYPVMEINVKQPALPTATQNAWASSQVRRNVTDQLLRMAGAAR